jgi:KaiC/GvpD/RAD55 family RecA-like ATPase
MTAEYILYRLVSRGTRTDKLPISPHTGAVCNAHDPTQWVTRDAAEAVLPFRDASGIALVINGDSQRFLLDIDHAITDGTPSPLAVDLLAQFPGAYAEVSQSGEGLHIIGRYQGAAPPHRCKDARLGIELYTRDRFVALTGTSARGDLDADCSAPLATVAQRYFAPTPAPIPAADWTRGPSPDWSGPPDDAELIHMMLSSRPGGAAVFGERATLRELWEGNADALARAYPSPSGDAYDRSSADAALFAHLAFWTGRDAARMWRLARQSALVREKWQREDYARATVLGACQRCERVLHQRRAADPIRIPAGGLLIPLDTLTARPQVLRWQIAGVLEHGVLAMLQGEPGAGKSFLALDMALAVATGTEWHGCRVNTGPVVYVAGEGHAGIARRARAWEEDRKTPLAGCPVRVSARAVRFLSPADVAELTSEIDALSAPPALIVIDTLARAFIGGDENSALDAGRFIAELDAIRERYGCTVLVVHHTAKNTGQARGSGAFRGAVDVEFSARREDDAIVLSCGKMKDGAVPPDYAFQLRDVTLPFGWVDDAGELLRSAVIVRGEPPPPAPLRNRKLRPNQQFALDILDALLVHGQPVTLKDWQMAATGGLEDGGKGGLPRARWAEAHRSLIEGGLARVLSDGTVTIPGWAPDPEAAPGADCG